MRNENRGNVKRMMENLKFLHDEHVCANTASGVRTVRGKFFLNFGQHATSTAAKWSNPAGAASPRSLFRCQDHIAVLALLLVGIVGRAPGRKNPGARAGNAA